MPSVFYGFDSPVLKVVEIGLGSNMLTEKPRNINQLAESLNLDYKAVQHHMSVLEKNNLVTKMGEKYGVTYFISNYLEANMDMYNEVKSKILR